MATPHDPASDATVVDLRRLLQQGVDEARLRAEVARIAIAKSASAADVRTWLASLGLDPATPLEPGAAPQRHPPRIGRFRILEALGEGGMGTVYRAEQDEPVRREVALKLIKPGMDSAAVVRRFEHERQALAMMEHDGIAKVYDCGTSESGQPFFVMELVRGMPLHDYCTKHRLPLEERIRLLQQVCAAVQHAHQKGIVHRDLKPGNVLVCDNNGRRQVKVIDFGLAKAIAPGLGTAPVTLAGHFVGTPEYTSPEQADPGNVDIDTRADVYSLGVMLYELLVDDLPFDGTELRRDGLLGLQRLLRDTDPPKPSARLSSAGERSTTIASSRNLRVSELLRALRNDLDWVVLRALEKDRERRYESPSALAADLQRFLDDQPLAAGPPSAMYRLRKFVRRHGLAMRVAAVVAVCVGITGTVLWHSDRAVAAVRDSANEELLAAHQRKIAERAKMRDTAGNGDLLRSTLDWERSDLLVLLQDPSRQFLIRPLVQTLLELVELEQSESRPDEAMQVCQEALRWVDAMTEPMCSAAEIAWARARTVLAEADLLRGSGEPSEATYDDAVAVTRRLVALDPSDDNLHQLSVACEHAGNQRAQQHGMESARPLIDESLRLLRDLADRNPGVERWQRTVHVACNKEARLAQLAGDPQAAAARFVEAIDISGRLHTEHPLDPALAQDHAKNLRAYGDCLLGLGKDGEALKHIEAARDLRLSVLLDEPLRRDAMFGLADDLFWLAQNHMALKDFTQASQEIREAETRITTLTKREPRNIAAARMRVQVLSNLAILHLNLGDSAAAERAMTRAGEAGDAVLTISTTAVDKIIAAQNWQFVAQMRAGSPDKTGAQEARDAARRCYGAAMAVTTGKTHRELEASMHEIDLESALAADDWEAVLRTTDQMLPQRRDACTGTTPSTSVFALFGALHYRRKAAQLLGRQDIALDAFAEIRTRVAPFRDGDASLDARKHYANELLAYVRMLRTAGRDATEVVNDARAWFEALRSDGEEVAEQMGELGPSGN